MGVIAELLRQAREAGDLGPDGPSNEHIVAGLVSLSKGSHLLAQGPAVFDENSDVRPLEVLFDNYHIFMDGAGWQPRWKEWDYDETLRRIETEVFPEEISLLEK